MPNVQQRRSIKAKTGSSKGVTELTNLLRDWIRERECVRETDRDAEKHSKVGSKGKPYYRRRREKQSIEIV